MVRVKICGITRPEDAQLAAAAGADAIGLIRVAASPRYVANDRVRTILAALPPLVTPVGVFMDTPVDEIQRTAAMLGLRTVQLHGDESPDYVAALSPLTVIKALPVRDEAIYDALRGWSRAGVAAILLDKPRTAEASDPAPMPWHLLTPEAIRRRCGTTVPLILAGGLTPDNVARAVRMVRPYGVDVASGIERSAGVKDADLIKTFLFEARQADSGATAG